MKKIKLFIVFLFMFIFMTNVKAACNNSELNDLAESFTAAYLETKDGKLLVDRSYYVYYNDEYAYLIMLYPYSDKLKVVVSDSIINKERVLKLDDMINAYIVGSYIHYEDKTYYISVYGADNSACPGELLKSFDFSVPKFNEYYLYDHCTNNDDDDEICTMMKNTDNISLSEYSKTVLKSNEENKIKNMTLNEKIIYYLKKYYLYAIIPVILISIYYVIKIRKYKKKVENQ